jgi:flagellar basal-body rod protein FlgB
MSDFLFDGLHQGMGRVLDLRQSQHALTAGNLANVDTPGYKAKVIPFDRILEEMVDRAPHLELRRTRGDHTPGLQTDPTDPFIQEIEAPPWAADGNSVIPEREAVRLKENATLYASVSRGLSRRLAMLRFAASDGTRG